MRSIALANGQMFLLLDMRGQIRDFYFPYVGLENHMGGAFKHRIGVYVDGTMSWFDDHDWDICINCANDTLSSDITATNNKLQLELTLHDTVYNEKNIFVRKVTVLNNARADRTVKIFFGHEFQIYESYRGDTAYYDPIHKCLIHYKGRRVFLINTQVNDATFDQYSTGLFGAQGKEGTYKDAEDGILEKNPIQHGKVDSVVGTQVQLGYKEEQTVYYWLAAATSIKAALDLNEYIIKKTPEHILQTTKDYWHAWVNQHGIDFCGIGEETKSLFNKSLLIVRAHVDNNGSILASGDSDMLNHGFDTYSYMWPRDGALTVMSMLKAGYLSNPRRFFEFCNDVITEDGYLMHKYRPDGSLGSSWHPWTRDGKVTLPIQEDETALVLYALWHYYESSKDLEFIETAYSTLIERASGFLMSYVDEKTGLPQASYDLWEEKYGTHTFSTAATYAALKSAAKFAEVLGKMDHKNKFDNAAEKIKEALLKYLYTAEDGFVKMVYFKDGKTVYDRTTDISSFYGIWKFGVLPLDDERVTKMAAIVEDRLLCRTEVGGYARYVGDYYFRAGEGAPGNPWFICTLWLMQYYIAIAKSEEDLQKPLQWIKWCSKYALGSGVLSEQLNPFTGDHLSATPLTWSHAEFVVTVVDYLDKMKELQICKTKVS